MKLLFTLLPFGLLFVNSCNKGTCNDGFKNQSEAGIDCGGPCSACSIDYPTDGSYGNNILYGTDTLNLTINDYSFKANLPKGSSLKLKLELISGSEWFYTSAEGWTISPYDNGVQTFELQNSGTSDLNFILAYSPNPSIIGGSFFIHYYENGDVINKTKVVSWN